MPRLATPLPHPVLPTFDERRNTWLFGTWPPYRFMIASEYALVSIVQIDAYGGNGDDGIEQKPADGLFVKI